ncbi:MAG: DUF3043 domain-containing protein [Actinomycetaceae bacterium]|nr:DUF3043 domain-containing protein [Actinomycetaceae bacterium]
MSFWKKKTSEVPQTSNDLDPSVTPKKGRPTPSRKESEARHFRPIVARDRKEAKARAREERNRQYMREQEGMMTGREDLMPLGERGPVRRFTRNFIDARFTFAEWMLPVVIAALLLNVLASAMAPEFALTISWVSIILMYTALFAGIIEAFVIAILVKKKAVAKFGEEAIPHRLRWYAFSRVISIRRWRRPAPQVKRGEKID